MTLDGLRWWVIRTCAEQGVAVKVRDRATNLKVAVLFGAGSEDAET